MSTGPDAQSLADRDATRACLARYHRAVDRADEALLRSVYWPDATERHASFDGAADAFVEWGLKLRDSFQACAHQISNVMIDLRGDHAVTEALFTSLQQRRDPEAGLVVDHLCGRYLDLFEARNGAWRIARRLVVYDWFERRTPTPGQSPLLNGGRFPDDPLYAHLARQGP